MQTRVHLGDQVAQLLIALTVPARFKVMDLPCWINNEDLVHLDPHISVADRVSVSVAKARIERVRIWREKLQDVLQAGNLEHLRLLLDHLSVE